MSAIVEALNRRANGGKPTLSFEFFPPKDDAFDATGLTFAGLDDYSDLAAGDDK